MYVRARAYQHKMSAGTDVVPNLMISKKNEASNESKSLNSFEESKNKRSLKQQLCSPCICSIITQDRDENQCDSIDNETNKGNEAGMLGKAFVNEVPFFKRIECDEKVTNVNHNETKKQAKGSSWLIKRSSELEDAQKQESDVDRGYAFVILAVMFIINASTYGTARAYGFIFEKSAREDSLSRSEAAIPFTVMGAFENMSGPLAGYILSRSGSWRFTVLTGSILVTISHSLAAIFDSLWGRIISMGFICGFGMSLITISKFQINNAYFVRYRSRAFGFCLTGAAFGTLYISPICRYMLNEHSINSCYLMLSAILLPNVPLSLLLRPKRLDEAKYVEIETGNDDTSTEKISSISEQVEQKFTSKIIGQTKTSDYDDRIFFSIKKVLSIPIFHLIWPTQLLFYWLNFVFGMIIVDFGKDRNLNEDEITYLVPTWAFGQLVGRLFLGALVDMNFISCKLFTVICLSSISLSTWLLTNVDRLFSETGPSLKEQDNEGIIVILIIFFLSMFIANLYILFNNLVSSYIERKLTAMSIGLSSFLGSFFLLPRAHIIGYYRDTEGNYDSMINLFAYVTALAAAIWLLVTLICPRQTSVKAHQIKNIA